MLFDPSYTKSIDVWSCSVIMFMMLNHGKHPIYQSKMDVEEYKKLLKTCKFPPLKDELAQNFIQKIAKREYSERYSVS